MGKHRKKFKNESFQSLFDSFILGDRVSRKHYNQINGKIDVYKGIIMAIDQDGIEIFWDMLNGKYRPNDMNIDFTYCSKREIFNGLEQFSPIKKDKKRY